MSEPLTLDATMDELAELATSRTAATGRRCAVASFTGSGRAHVMDLDAAGEVVEAWCVPLMHPSPGAIGQYWPIAEANEF